MASAVCYETLAGTNKTQKAIPMLHSNDTPQQSNDGDWDKQQVAVAKLKQNRTIIITTTLSKQIQSYSLTV